MYTVFLKRLFDLLMASFGLLCLLPVFLAIILLLIVINKGKVFFIQSRPGKNGKVFRIIKFKTMNDKRDQEGRLLPDRDRLTRTGKFLRRISLDELPQLINLLKGEMSLVGPRPLLTDYLPLYTKEQARRHEIRPGITGWAQVNGRNTVAWEQRFAYDTWYVDHLSFALDLKILWLTVVKVLKTDGINASKGTTMTRFQPYEKQ